MSPFPARLEAQDGTLPVQQARIIGPDGGALASLSIETDLSNCLIPLLRSLGWQGDPRHIAESIPHFSDSLDLTGFRNVLAHLDYETRIVPATLDSVDPRLMPCLFMPDDGASIVLIGQNPKTLRIFDGERGIYSEIPIRKIKGQSLFCIAVEREDQRAQHAREGWFKSIVGRFRGLTYQLLGLTLFLNLLALATPLFVMAVYDKVIATGSMATLNYLAIGVGIAIGFDAMIRFLRARILAYVGARLDNIVGNAVFQKILHLPPSFTERSTIGAQVARMKDFESVREFFTGPMAIVFLELPFVLLFVAVIAVLGGPVAIVPLVMIALFAVLGAIMAPFVQHSVAQAARAGSRRQEFLVETLFGMRAVKYTGSERIWLDRYRELSAKASLSGFRTSQVSSIVNALSQMLMIGSGVATVAFGVVRVLSGDMTVGALVACMILVWRVLSPLQMGFISFTRLSQIRTSVTQINQLMNLKAERNPEEIVNSVKRVTGRVTFSRVSIRYSPDADPALVGVSFDLMPGEVLALIGANGSGKSTILKLLMGIYVPQAGNIRIDDMDIRQLEPIEHRYSIAYVPQTVELFYGTVAQNLRLANPVASDDDLFWAAEKANILNDILRLESGDGRWKRTGFDARLGDSGAARLPASLKQGLNLARGYLKRSPVMLFDEPGSGLDFAGDQAFMRAVQEMRSHTTIMIVTHRPSHLRLADKIAWLDSGHLRAFGPAEDVLTQLPKDFL